MNKYNNSQIVILSSHSLGSFHILGSTSKLLSVIKGSIKHKYIEYQQGKLKYRQYFNIVSQDDFDVKLLEAYNCENKIELDKRVSTWHEFFGGDISVLDDNMKIALSKSSDEKTKEYLSSRKDLIHKQYYNYKNNKVYQSQYYKNRNNSLCLNKCNICNTQVKYIKEHNKGKKHIQRSIELQGASGVY